MKRFGELMFNHMTEQVGPSKTRGSLLQSFLKVMVKQELTDSDVVLNQDRTAYGERLFRCYTEINDTFRSLSSIDIYLDQYPFREERIPRSRYLDNCLHMFIHELHILRERMISTTRMVERSFKECGAAPPFQHKAREMRLLEEILYESVAQIRNKHVHVKRYDHPETALLLLLELMGQNAESAELREMIQKEYGRICAEWRKNLDAAIDGLRMLLDHYFSILCETLFRYDETLIVPKLLSLPPSDNP